jgi:F-type H+-transporting ATPase subunit b
MAQIIDIFVKVKGILVLALPTFFLFIALHWYLKKVLFQPMERILAERRKKTAGAVEAAEKALALAAEKMAAYEKALFEARASIYSGQEQNRKRLIAVQANAIDEAKRKTADQVAAAREEFAAEAATARESLQREADRLSDQIATALLAGRN